MKLPVFVATLALTAASSVAQAQINCSIDWNTRYVALNNNNRASVAGAHAYGLNLYNGYDPDIAGQTGNATYKDNVKFMNPGIVRYSRIGNTGQMADSTLTGSGWVINPKGLNGQPPRWDRAKIQRALRGSFSFYPTKLMNIAGWPEAWQISSTDGRLDPAHYADYANFCADLIRAINCEMGGNYAIDYWEVMNEPDSVYSGSTGAAQVASIYNQAASKMREVRAGSLYPVATGNPTKSGNPIKVGGPAFLNTFYSGTVDGVLVNVFIDKFLELTRNGLDFVSYHQYATGSSADDDVLFAKAATLGEATGRVRKSLARWPSSTRTVSLYHDEWNMFYAANSGSQAQQSDVRSAMFDAIGLASMVKAGADATMAWNEADGWYGKMGNNFDGYARRHSTYLFNLYNTHMRGNVVTSSTADATRIYVYPVISGGKKNFVIVNQHYTDQPITMTFTGATPTGYRAYQIRDSQMNPGTGFTVSNKALTYRWTLPGQSVTVFVQDGTSTTSSTTPLADSPSGATF